jgi:polysaccharide deacetylase 2 family uncharacterized protein YibQ
MKPSGGDELNTPLGNKVQPKRLSLPLFNIALAVLATLVLIVGAWVLLVDDPMGGDPVAVVAVDKTASAVVSDSSVTRTPGVSHATSEEADAAGIVGGAGQSKILRVPEPVLELPERSDGAVVITELSPSSNLALAAAPDIALTEQTPDGAIPRIAADGRRPMDLYARPMDALAVGTARVAIVVGGLGISESGTQAAIAALPGPVTLAFAPYGADLAQWIEQARAGGHELLLQLPLEPFDYPNNDPGPKTLLVDAAASENLKRLQWLLSRFGTYVGAMNYMGGRFTSEPKAMETVLGELGKRGLLYVDDGTSVRSRAREASQGRVPFAAADMVLDAEPDAAAIDARLTQLEAIARERGHAIGVASAYPVSIDRIAAWAKDAARRGVVLVPVTAVASANPS